MFLSKQNKIKWRLLVFVTVIVLAMVVAGIYWFDKPLYIWFRNFDCGLFKLFERLFDAWVWLLVFGVLTLIVYLRKVVKAGNVKFLSWFNAKNFMLNMKTTNVFLIFCKFAIEFLKYGIVFTHRDGCKGRMADDCPSRPLHCGALHFRQEMVDDPPRRPD